MTRDKGGVLDFMQIPDNAIRSLASADKLPEPLCVLLWVAFSIVGWAAVYGIIWGLV